MSLLFIADLHLDAERPQTTRQFLDFLSGECRGAEALYILGDLFEAWIGDDDGGELAQSVRDGLAACRAAGTRLFLQRGNRDFLLGPTFADTVGAQLLPDFAVITCAGEPALLMHGDLLCTQDTEYLAFRAQVRDPAWQAAFLAQPLAQRQAFAERARQASQARQQGLKDASQLEPITDVTPADVLAVMRRYGVRRLIHGHTHRPARHALEIDGMPAERIVLGDWYTQASCLREHDGLLELSAAPAG